MRSHLALVVVLALGGAACSSALQPSVRVCPAPQARGSGNAIGIIGMSLDRRASASGGLDLVVDRVVPDGPAATAGIRAGDRILEIEDAPTEDMSIGDAARRLRGPIDASVALVILTDGRSRDVTITRVAPSALWNATGRAARTGRTSVPATDLAPAAKAAVPPCHP
ncbi:MAG: PDZ domain-containing protein [Deltaproteobacteria bacterium]|nr:PDZ domain-containing protein [Deltaproteobacteria bacterium]